MLSQQGLGFKRGSGCTALRGAVARRCSEPLLKAAAQSRCSELLLKAVALPAPQACQSATSSSLLIAGTTKEMMQPLCWPTSNLIISLIAGLPISYIELFASEAMDGGGGDNATRRVLLGMDGGGAPWTVDGGVWTVGEAVGRQLQVGFAQALISRWNTTVLKQCGAPLSSKFTHSNSQRTLVRCLLSGGPVPEERGVEHQDLQDVAAAPAGKAAPAGTGQPAARPAAAGGRGPRRR